MNYYNEVYKKVKHYRERIIEEYSKKLTIDVGKGYSKRNLWLMLKYYNFIARKKIPTVSAKLSWSHYVELLSIKKIN